MGAAEVTAFLTALDVSDRVRCLHAESRPQRLLYSSIARSWHYSCMADELVRAKTTQHLPIVLTRDEVRVVIGRLDGVPRLKAPCFYGAGLE